MSVSCINGGLAPAASLDANRAIVMSHIGRCGLPGPPAHYVRSRVGRQRRLADARPPRASRAGPLSLLAPLLRTVCDLHARVELCFAAAKQERDGDAFFELGDQRVDLLGAPGVDARPLADHCQDHVAGLNVATRVAADVLDEYT